MVVEGREGSQWQMRVGRARIVSVWSRREVSNPKTILFLLQRTRRKSPVRRITLDSTRLTTIRRAVRCQRRRVLVRITLTAPANLESTQPWRILEILLICARHDFRRNGDSGQFKKKGKDFLCGKKHDDGGKRYRMVESFLPEYQKQQNSRAKDET